MKFVIRSVSILFFTILFSGFNRLIETQEPRLNHFQVIGSHNSYKQSIEPAFFKLLVTLDSGAIGLEYHHLPLTDQLETGLRGLEIDVSHDPTGGRYQHPKGIEWAKQAGITLPPHDTMEVLKQPGMKVLHVADIDFNSNCLTFKSCLNEIKSWSFAHPGHSPIFITINTKDSGLNRPGATKVLPFTAPVLDSLDAEIFSVFTSQQLITPTSVKGKSQTLKQAVQKNGWPTIRSVKGKIMFILDSPDQITDTYIASGKDRPMFVSVGEENPNAAFFILNDPKHQKEQIKALVGKGFIVRTRADADTREARMNDYSRWEAAESSGAQLISTDYYLAKLSPNGKFQISFPNGKYERDNPVIFPKSRKRN